MNITDAEMQMLRDTKNEVQWNDACDSIKAARGGAYPLDWWPRVMQSGLAHTIMARWDDPDVPKITVSRLVEEEE